MHESDSLEQLAVNFLSYIHPLYEKALKVVSSIAPAPAKHTRLNRVMTYFMKLGQPPFAKYL